jgi:hypothetical protein
LDLMNEKYPDSERIEKKLKSRKKSLTSKWTYYVSNFAVSKDGMIE